MSWTPISGTIPQYDNPTGAAASGYYLKFYQAGTTTAFSMATDSTGGTTLDKCELSSNGYPTTDGSNEFIPHVDQSYKIVLYKESDDADNNNTANAAWEEDNVQQFASVDLIPTGTEKIFETVAAMVASTTLNVGDHARTLGYISIGDGGQNEYDIVAASTGTDDGGVYIDLASYQAKGLFPGGAYNVHQWGAEAAGSANETAIQGCIDYVDSLGGGVVNLLPNTYDTTAAITLYNRILLNLGGGIIEQQTDGVSIVDCCGEAAYTARIGIINGRLNYASQQTAVGGSAILMGSGTASGIQNFLFENLSITKPYHGFYCPDGFNVFLGAFKNTTVVDHDSYAYSFGGGASVHTNLVLENTWAVQTSGSERSGSRGYLLQNIQELNVINMAADRMQETPIIINTCTGRIGNIALENCTRTSSSGGTASLIQATGSKLDISYIHFNGNTVTLTGTTSVGMLYADGSEIDVTLIRDYNTALTIGSGTYYTIYTTNAAVVNNMLCEADGTSPAIANSDSSANTPALTRVFNGDTKLLELDGISVGTKTAIPATTGYPEFSIVLHSDPALGEPLGWRRIGTDWIPIDTTESKTTTLLADISDDINTVGKFAGKMVWNSTTNAPVWAEGAAAADVWNDATGSTAHTPV